MARFRSPWLLAAAILLAACSPADDGAVATVEEFYEHLDEGNLESACAMYNAQVRTMMQKADGTLDESFSTWAASETREGTLESVEVVRTGGTADVPEVEFDLVYEGGSKARRTVALTREDEQWRLGFVTTE